LPGSTEKELHPGEGREEAWTTLLGAEHNRRIAAHGTPSRRPAGHHSDDGQAPQPGDDLPVTSVSWKEAQEFCAKRSQREGSTYRLPTEAEWEHACRAGGDTPAGTAELAAAAWYADNSEESPHPVGQKEPNPWGLHDLLGNVAEWTLDAYGPYPRVDEDTDPKGPAAGSTRVVRGGSWRGFAPALRCAARTGTPESYQLPHVGLRVVQEIE
jgi:formylglycine-generating enzyme